MNNNIKIALKIGVIVAILMHLPLQRIYSEGVENVVSTMTTEVKNENVSTSNGKSIYIYNTHQSEKYASQSVVEGSRYLMQLLENRGYQVNYETTDFELYKMQHKINYRDSYVVSKKYLNNALKQNEQYDLIIDFHRDSIKKSLSTITYDQKDYAKLMFVVGKSSGNYQNVKTMCQKISDQLNDLIPHISRGIMTKQNHYNQGTADRMVLIEVGANENTYQEVQNSLNILALAIDKYLSV